MPRFDTGKTYDSGQKYDQSDPPTQAEMQDFAAWVESFRVSVTR